MIKTTRLLSVFLLVSMIFLVSGCDGDKPVESSSSATSTAASSPRPSFLPRPKAINTTGTDPCLLLTKEQRKTLSVDGILGKQDGYPRCNFDKTLGQPFYGYQIFLKNHGIEFWFDGESIGAKPTLSSVGGFSAAVIPQGKSSCTIAIDSATGQTVNVMFEGITQGMTTSPEQACDKAKQAAELVVTTMLEAK